jgi:hypothetical protein
MHKFLSKYDQIIFNRILCVEEKSQCDMNIFLCDKKRKKMYLNESRKVNIEIEINYNWGVINKFENDIISY